MPNPTLDDVAAMNGTDFANFANNYTPEVSPEGEAPVAEVTPEVTPDPTSEVPNVDGTEPETNIEEEGSTPASLSPDEFFSKLSEPMKAAGKEYTFTDPEEIRTLMKKGIGFEKRMGGLKKFERQISALDAQGLLENEDTINLIIDLAKGNPEALKQYIEKNQIDVYDVIGLDTSDYTPKKHVASQEDFEQEQITQEIKSYDGYELIKPLAEETWDVESQRELLAKPELAASMIEAAKVGVHDMVVKEAEKVKLLTSTPMTDLEAYIKAGDKLHKSGAFDKIAKGKSNVSDATTIQPTNVAPRNTQAPRKSSTPQMSDIADMSEEELRKFAAEHGI